MTEDRTEEPKDLAELARVEWAAQRERKRRARVERYLARLAKDLKLDRADIARVLGAAVVLDGRGDRTDDLRMLRDLAQPESPF